VSVADAAERVQRALLERVDALARDLEALRDPVDDDGGRRGCGTCEPGG
jgi:hypothetical protein